MATAAGAVPAKISRREVAMFLLIEAQTRRSLRRFIVAAYSAEEAKAEMRALIEEGVMITDEEGDWFKAREIDEWSLAVKGVPTPPNPEVYNHFTHDAQRIV
jgi:hypothetical protein